MSLDIVEPSSVKEFVESLLPFGLEITQLLFVVVRLPNDWSTPSCAKPTIPCTAIESLSVFIAPNFCLVLVRGT